MAYQLNPFEVAPVPEWDLIICGQYPVLWVSKPNPALTIKFSKVAIGPASDSVQAFIYYPGGVAPPWLAVIKRNYAGEITWSQTAQMAPGVFSGPSVVLSDQRAINGLALELDEDGFSYIAVYTHNPLYSSVVDNPKYFIFCIDLNGAIVWQKTYENYTTGQPGYTLRAVRKLGNYLYILGGGYNDDTQFMLALVAATGDVASKNDSNEPVHLELTPPSGRGAILDACISQGSILLSASYSAFTLGMAIYASSSLSQIGPAYTLGCEPFYRLTKSPIDDSIWIAPTSGNLLICLDENLNFKKAFTLTLPIFAAMSISPSGNIAIAASNGSIKGIAPDLQTFNLSTTLQFLASSNYGARYSGENHLNERQDYFVTTTEPVSSAIGEVYGAKVRQPTSSTTLYDDNSNALMTGISSYAESAATVTANPLTVNAYTPTVSRIVCTVNFSSMKWQDAKQIITWDLFTREL